jgi:WD40 repeat protein
VLAAGRRSGEISIWNIETGQAAAKPLRADGVVQVAFLPDGRLVTASMDDAIRVWDWRKRITTASFPVRQSVGNWALAVDPLGKFIASTGKPGEVVVWRLGDRQTSRQVLVRSRGDVASLAFSRDGTYLAAGDERNIEVWRLDGPNRAAQPFAQFSGHTSVVQGLSFSPDGTHLLSGATDNTVRVWTLGSGGSIALQLHPKGGPEGQRVAFSADSSLVAGSSGDGTVRLWRLPDGTLVRSLKVPGIRPEALQFSPSGSLLVVGGRSTMRQPPTEGTFGAVATESGVLLGELQSRRNVVRSLRYSGDGSNLIVAEDGGGLSVWDAAGKQRFQELPPRGNGFTASITVSRDGRIIVPQSEKGVRIYRLPDLRLEGEALQDYKIGAVAVSDANSAFIAGASFGGDIHAWNLNTNQRLRIISGLRTNIYALGFSPSGSMFASAGNEGVWLWDWRSATRISHQLYSETLVQDVQFSPDGSYAAAASYNGSFWVWNLSIDRLEAIACRIANRDLSGEERELYAPSGVRDPLCERRDGDMVPAGIPRLSPKGSQHDRTFGRLSR